jgi:hypothetical protein
MSESTLSFVSSSSFRNSLIARNLAPYNVQGTYSPPAGNVTYEVSPLQDSSVIDSPDNYIGTNQFANGLYPLNEYGPDGGFSGKYSVPGQPLPVDSNQGPYNPNDPEFQSIDLINEFFIDAAYIQNKYGPEGGFNDLFTITDIQLSEQYFQSYNEPFVTSLYKPYQILTSQNPNGTSGLLSQDTYLAKIAASSLKSAFEERIAYEVTFLNAQGPSIPLGFGNLNTLNSPFSNLFTNFNNQPLSNKDWKITVGADTQSNNQQFTNRIQENYYPASPIPGDYFDTFSPIQAPVVETALENINNITGNVGPILSLMRNPSETFISNTGKAQQSVLFNSLDYNTYRPSYNRGSVSANLQNAVTNFLDNDPQITGKYYVGSAFSEPSLIESPPNQVAVNSFGKQQNTIVYGPSELGILYEGNEQKLNFGLKGKSITDGGGIMGEFIWTSPKYQANAGFKVGRGGDPVKPDPDFNTDTPRRGNDFNSVSSQFSRDKSVDFDLKSGSILDDTQRIIDAADKLTGKARLKHVGNAINQVSKVFNDGYKELTKGSQVIAYYDSVSGGETIGINGNEVGREYCRVFQKDTPYYTYGDLQKTDGITTSGRKFHNSVLDNTFNLNIAPMRGEGSTNIRDGRVKKYMFSLENLAWRTSDKPGFTIQDLPTCERGPNGGRIMWFPPYDLSFSEDSKAQWNPTKFLGRPEPIYTYQNSSRSGTISWKIVVDNPSSLNTIIEKQLAKKTDQEVNSIVDSFFAGCVKYDLYDLAAKFNQIPISELYTYQEILNDARTTPEEVNTVLSEISKIKEEKSGGANSGNQTTDGTGTDNSRKKVIIEEELTPNYMIYFAQGQPRISGGKCEQITSDDDYSTYYKNLLTQKTTKVGNNGNYVANKEAAKNNGVEYPADSVIDFFNKEIEKSVSVVDEFLDKIGNILGDGGEVNMTFVGATNTVGGGSACNQTADVYNRFLAKRRYDSVLQYLFQKKVSDTKTFKDYYTDGKLILAEPEALAFQSIVSYNGNTINCNETKGEFNVPAMACRSVILQSYTTKAAPVDPVIEPNPDPDPNPDNTVIITPPKKPVKKPDPVQKLKEGISKKILRNLFSECDYFEAIKETNPMVYESIKEKIKYFSPAFHSTTPEGLNSRLTFLNQCMRPGQTIPVVGNDNQLKYNDALNTSFGTPPVLVLRIGDFYHTKIIPNSLGITFDPLVYDINPEGIGVQPMIAKITLSFDFIGGQGLAGPIKQLQNALSFNYYGNTEIYDERSISTDKKEISDRDLQLAKLIVGNAGPPVKSKDVENQISQKGLTPIGNIVTTNLDTTTGIETGEISYYNLMGELQENTKNYFNTVVNQNKSITEVTNWGISQLVYKKSNYTKGNILDLTLKKETVLYGKPDNISKRFGKLIDNCVKDVNDDTNPIIVGMNNIKNIPSNIFRNIKETLKKTLKTNEIELNLLVQQQVNSIVATEETLNYSLRKTDVVCDNLDGVKLKTGDIKVYSLSAESTNQLITEITDAYQQSTQRDLIYFLNLLKTKIILSESFYDEENTIYTSNSGDLKITTIPDKRYYMGMSNILLNNNKFDAFVNSLIDSEVKKINGLELQIKEICTGFKNRCYDDHVAEIKYFETLDKDVEFQEFSKYEIKFTLEGASQTINFFKDKKIGYTTEEIGNSGQKKKKIKDLYNNKNLNENKETFNGKTTFN